MNDSTLRQDNNIANAIVGNTFSVLIWAGLIGISTIIVLISLAMAIIKMSIGLALLQAARFLIPSFIRAAFVKTFPPLVTTIASPLIFLLAGAAAKLYTARDHVLRLRQELADEENALQNGERNVQNYSPLERVGITTQTFLTKYERELYNAPLESAAEITGAAVVLTATGPAGIIATATMTSIGAFIGRSAYDAVTYTYNYMRGIPNNPEMDIVIDAIQNFQRNAAEGRPSQQPTQI